MSDEPVQLRTPGTASGPGLQGTLGVRDIVFMVVAAAAPLTVIGGGTPIGIMLGNGAGFPATYVVSAVVLLLFAVGLCAMSRFVDRPGAFFTYIAQGLGPAAGVGAAKLALLTYTAVQVSIYGYLGAQLGAAVHAVGGPSLPWWAYALAVVAATGVLGYRRIELSSKVLGLLLLGEIAIVVALDVAIVLRGGAQGLSLTPFTPSAALAGAPGIGLMFAVAGFVGFESTAVFRDEARDPVRTVPRATYLSIALIGVFYAVSSWALVMAWGTSNIAAAAAQDPAGLIFTTMDRYLGGVAVGIVRVLLLTSLFACVLSFHNVIARYVHALAGARVLPRGAARVHPEHGSPHVGSALQTGSALVIVAAFAVAGLDPVAEVFTWMSGLATLGVLVLMALTCLAVLVYFRRNPGLVGRWQSTVAPGLGLVGLVALTAVVHANFTLLIGGRPGLALGFEALVVGALAAGLVTAATIRVRRPGDYRSMATSMSG